MNSGWVLTGGLLHYRRYHYHNSGFRRNTRQYTGSEHRAASAFEISALPRAPLQRFGCAERGAG